MVFFLTTAVMWWYFFYDILMCFMYQTRGGIDFFDCDVDRSIFKTETDVMFSLKRCEKFSIEDFLFLNYALEYFSWNCAARNFRVHRGKIVVANPYANY